MALNGASSASIIKLVQGKGRKNISIITGVKPKKKNREIQQNDDGEEEELRKKMKKKKRDEVMTSINV